MRYVTSAVVTNPLPRSCESLRILRWLQFNKPRINAWWALAHFQKVIRESLFGDSAAGLCFDKLARD